MSMAETILDLLIPPRCAFCGAIMPRRDSGVCTACEKALPFRPEGKIVRKAEQFDCAVTFYYEDMVRTGIHAMKFRRRPQRTRVFAQYLAQTVAEELGGQFDAVTYVPVHPLRRLVRGYDQSRLLAEACARIWQVKTVKTLWKTRNNPPQSSVKTPAGRRANVLGAYRPRQSAAIAGTRFLLIDDVVTTGSTLSACAQALMLAGAQSVVCAALAGDRQQRA